jgi:RNA polymerase sigma factor (sigma-70 family)
MDAAPSAPTHLDAAHRAVEAVWRIERSRVIATLVRFTGDIDEAEELASEALLAALERWPESGVPRTPGAWLTAVAKNKAIDGWRRHANLADKYALLAAAEPAAFEPEPPEAIDDDLLRLMFTACHPVIPRQARVALTLRLLGGLTTEEIARAFLVPPATVAQRITRAKKAISAAGVPFEIPDGDQLGERLHTVLEVIYLVFNEGYAATAGDDWMRPSLCGEALRLGRSLAALAPREAEVHGLVALMELQASRLAARTDAAGEPVLLDDQDRTRWDRLQIRRGMDALATAFRIDGGRGAYALQAAIASCHATARAPDDTDWPAIVALYDRLLDLAPSPVVTLNRAVAVARAGDPAAALESVDALGALEGYAVLPVVRGDLLERLGRVAEAREEFRRAASLTRNERERALLLRRADP